VGFARAGKDRLFGIAEAQWLVPHARKPVRVEFLGNLFGWARQHFNLECGVPVPEANSPTPRVGLGVKIADENIASGLGHAR
jgi:hypothetical protein